MLDTSPALAALGLFGGTFVQEGIALAAGALLILRGELNGAWAGLSLFLGMVTGDCSIYGLGAAARHSGFAKRLIKRVDLEKAKTSLDRHLVPAIAASHLIPWVLFPTFVAFGWFSVPFRRFALTSVLFNAVYVPMALLVLTTAGAAAWTYFSDRIWLMWLVAAVVFTALIVLRWSRARAAS